MVNKLFVVATTTNKMPSEKKPLGRLRQSEFFFHLLLWLITSSHQGSLCWSYPPSYLSRIIQIFDRTIVISDKVWRTSTLFELPFWFLRNYPLQIKRLPVTERGRYPRPPSMAINTTATLDSLGLLDPLF